MSVSIILPKTVSSIEDFCYFTTSLFSLILGKAFLGDQDLFPEEKRKYFADIILPVPIPRMFT